MKISLMDRLLTVLAGVVLVLLGIGLFVFGLGIFPFQLDLTFGQGTFTFWQHVLMVVIAVMLLLLGLRSITHFLRSGKEKGFILQRTEYGDLNISMNAMENMVKKCVDMNDELKVTQTKIAHAREGVIVSMRILLENGVNIPMIVSALQKQTKQYITSCSGVDVKEVRVFVDTSSSTGAKHKGEKTSGIAADANAAEKAGRMVDKLNDSVQRAIQSDAPAQKTQPEKKETLHQRIFKKKAEDVVLPDKQKDSEAKPSSVLPPVVVAPPVQAEAKPKGDQANVAKDQSAEPMGTIKLEGTQKADEKKETDPHAKEDAQ